MGRPSNKRSEILAFIREFQENNGYAPSIREIMEAVDLHSTATVHYHLKELNRSGQISVGGGKNRAISVSQSRGVPIVGVVTAGQPILAVENIEGYLPWDADQECFALRVRGDSMIEAGIFDGDKVVVRPQQTADHGQIVVAMIGDEATVKRLYRKNGEIWLMPENAAYEPIDGSEAQILGLVRAVIREF